MKQFSILVLFTFLFGYYALAQKSSLIVLGDLHYDLLDDHDMNWLGTKPDDLRQVTKEYTVYTEKNWSDFMTIIRNKAVSENPPVKAVIQLGDLSEGLAIACTQWAMFKPTYSNNKGSSIRSKSMGKSQEQ